MRVVSSMDLAAVRGLHTVAIPWIVAIVSVIFAIVVVVILISTVHYREGLQEFFGLC